VSREHQTKPGAGKSTLTGPSHHGHDATGPGKRTLTEALPHKPARRHRDRDVDRSEGGPSVKVPLVAGKPAKAASAPVPEKDEAKDEVKDDAGTDVRNDDHAGDEAPTARAASALTLAQAIHQYAPVVYMAKGEEYRAANAGEFINNSSLKWSHQKKGKDEVHAGEHQIKHAALGRGGYSDKARNDKEEDVGDAIASNADARPKDGRGPGKDEGFYLDLNDDNQKSRRPGTDAPVYYEAKDRHYITYWFFYAFNQGPVGWPASGTDDHEGDWERICVRLDSNNRATEVAFFQHDGHKTLPWSKVTKEGATHPVVYSAKGSHASYESPGSKGLKFKGAPTTVKDHASKAPGWAPAPPHGPTHLRNVEDEAWFGYGGAWGEPGSIKETTGPQGPSGFKKPAPDGW
jgi:hypothetical protein